MTKLDFVLTPEQHEVLDSGETLHASTLATLHQEYATVIDSEVLMRHLGDPGLDGADA